MCWKEVLKSLLHSKYFYMSPGCQTFGEDGKAVDDYKGKVAKTNVRCGRNKDLTNTDLETLGNTTSAEILMVGPMESGATQ